MRNQVVNIEIRTHFAPQSTYTLVAFESTSIVFVPENMTGPKVTPLVGVPVGEPFYVC
jgi:hypothetical protein